MADPLIAIVDDDGSIRKALSRLVLAHGLQVASYASGEALLDDLPQITPVCVLLDLNLPTLTGMEVLRHLSAAHGTIPSIVMTGFDRVGLRDQCFAAGASAYLTKPISAADFTGALALALSRGDE